VPIFQSVLFSLEERGFMGQTAEQIVKDIGAYIEKHGGANSTWYVGIATSPRDRLFDDHNVTEKGGVWIYRQAESSVVARAVEKSFLEVGYKGGPGGGDGGTDYVYAYKITSDTKE
jgi:hypothetical protein